jgi:hypothetical protein
VLQPIVQLARDHERCLEMLKKLVKLYEHEDRELMSAVFRRWVPAGEAPRRATARRRCTGGRSTMSARRRSGTAAPAARSCSTSRRWSRRRTAGASTRSGACSRARNECDGRELRPRRQGGPARNEHPAHRADDGAQGRGPAGLPVQEHNCVEVALHSDSSHRNGGQMVPAGRRVLYVSLLTAAPTLIEPFCLAEITAPLVVCGGVHCVE